MFVVVVGACVVVMVPAVSDCGVVVVVMLAIASSEVVVAELPELSK